MLIPEFVTPFVERTARQIGCPVIVTDVSGNVLASSHSTPKGPFDSLARQTLTTRGRLTFAGREPYAQGVGGPGLAVSIRHREEPLGLLISLGSGDEICRFSEYTRDMIEIAYVRMLHAELPNWEVRADEALVHDLLSAAADDQRCDLLHARGRILGYNLNLPRCAIVAEFDRQGPMETRSLMKQLRTLLWNSPQDLGALVSETQLVIFQVINPQRTQEEIREAVRARAQELHKGLTVSRPVAIRIGIGDYHPGVAGVAESFREANRALVVAKRFRPNSLINHVVEMGLGRILSAVDTAEARSFAQEVLRDLHEKELIHTLLTLFRHDLSISETARALFVHRNTLLYRLDLIRRLTSLDPRRFEDASLLHLAFSLLQFNESMPA